MSEQIETTNDKARAGSEEIPCGNYWCLRPKKSPTICYIRDVLDETPSGEPLPRIAIRFLESGSDFYFQMWRKLYAQDATFIPVELPNTKPSGGGTIHE